MLDQTAREQGRIEALRRPHDVEEARRLAKIELERGRPEMQIEVDQTDVGPGTARARQAVRDVDRKRGRAGTAARSREGQEPAPRRLRFRIAASLPPDGLHRIEDVPAIQRLRNEVGDPVPQQATHARCAKLGRGHQDRHAGLGSFGREPAEGVHFLGVVDVDIDHQGVGRRDRAHQVGAERFEVAEPKVGIHAVTAAESLDQLLLQLERPHHSEHPKRMFRRHRRTPILE